MYNVAYVVSSRLSLQYLCQKYDFLASRFHNIFTVFRLSLLSDDEVLALLSEPLDAARKRLFDVVLVWRFDRFARSTKHLVDALHEFRNLDIDFISYQEAIDTSSPIGEAMFTIIGAMAKLERDIIVERVKAGMRKAKERCCRVISVICDLFGIGQKGVISQSEKTLTKSIFFCYNIFVHKCRGFVMLAEYNIFHYDWQKTPH